MKRMIAAEGGARLAGKRRGKGVEQDQGLRETDAKGLPGSDLVAGSAHLKSLEGSET
jgi:hypothetical protein